MSLEEQAEKRDSKTFYRASWTDDWDFRLCPGSSVLGVAGLNRLGFQLIQGQNLRLGRGAYGIKERKERTVLGATSSVLGNLFPLVGCYEIIGPIETDGRHLLQI